MNLQISHRIRTVLVAAPIFAAALAPATLLAANDKANSIASAASCAEAVSVGPEAEAVKRLEERGAQVNVEGWTIEEAREVFTPTWVSVGPDGSVRGVADVYATFVDGRSKPWAKSFDLLELDVRVYCDVAVVIGLAEARGSAPEQVTRFRYLNVWRKIEGKWRYSEQQFVRL